MMFAIIETGAKQYLVSPQMKLRIEKLPHEVGQEVVFEKVLLTSSEKETKLGHPYLEGASVKGRVLKQGRSRKIKIFKYKSKVRYRRRKGHRQEFTEVEVETIS